MDPKRRFARVGTYGDVCTDGQFCYRFRVAVVHGASRLIVNTYDLHNLFKTPAPVLLSVSLLLTTHDGLHAHIEASEPRDELVDLVDYAAEKLLFLTCRAATEHLLAADSAWHVHHDGARGELVRSSLALLALNDAESAAELEAQQTPRARFCVSATTTTEDHERRAVRESHSTLLAFRTRRNVSGTLSRDEFFAYFEGLMFTQDEHEHLQNALASRQRARRARALEALEAHEWESDSDTEHWRIDERKFCCEAHSSLGNVVGIEVPLYGTGRSRMRGTLRRDALRRQLAFEGDLFTRAYMSVERAGLHCTIMLQKLERLCEMRGITTDEQRTMYEFHGDESSASLFCRVATAMQRLRDRRILVAYPLLDPIASFRLTQRSAETMIGRALLSHLKHSEGKEATDARVECHLPSHTYIFGVQGHEHLFPYYALMSMLGQIPGETAWRLRGSIATSTYDAISISRAVGTSTIPVLASFGQHAVLLVMRISRDRHGSVTDTHLLGRDSQPYTDDMAALHAAMTREFFDEAESGIREHPRARATTRITSKWHDAGDDGWLTQAGDGSCTLQALMVALRIAHDEMAGRTTFVDRRLGELCPIEYAAVCAEALRVSPRPAETNLVFRVPKRGDETQHDDAPALVTYGIVRCDGSVLCLCIMRHTGAESRESEHILESIRVAEHELGRAARHKRGALRATFRAEDWARMWPAVSAAARDAGYTVTRRDASKVYFPQDSMV